MADKRLFIERRPQGDYAVRRADSRRASAIAPTQAKAIEKARDLNPGKRRTSSGSVALRRAAETSGVNPNAWER